MKTAETIANEIWSKWANYFKDDGPDSKVVVKQSVDLIEEYADIKVKEFKEKLKKQLEHEDRVLDWSHIEHVKAMIDRFLDTNQK